MYLPLRVHGHHSMLTGVDAPAALVERAAALGLPGLALADVDTLAGLVDFLSAAKKARERTGRPFRAIVGAEISDASDGPERFRLVEQAVRHQEGLVFLADHPRLLVELHGRVDARSLFAAISPAAL